jgi:hypothetical protein
MAFMDLFEVVIDFLKAGLEGILELRKGYRSGIRI